MNAIKDAATLARRPGGVPFGEPDVAVLARALVRADGTLFQVADEPVAAHQASHSLDYTTVLGDAHKQMLHPLADDNARTFTIEGNNMAPYKIGTVIAFVNRVNTVTIAIGGGDTLILAGAGTTGSRTLAANGMATALKIGQTEWMISGGGLT